VGKDDRWLSPYRTLIALAALKAYSRLVEAGSAAAPAMGAYAESMLTPDDAGSRVMFETHALRLALLLMDPDATGNPTLRDIANGLSEGALASQFTEGHPMDTIGGKGDGTKH
jgi:hypothetical protein